MTYRTRVKRVDILLLQLDQLTIFREGRDSFFFLVIQLLRLPRNIFTLVSFESVLSTDPPCQMALRFVAIESPFAVDGGCPKVSSNLYDLFKGRHRDRH